jgi:ATP-binding cassette, subfamily B, bacterial
MAMLRVVAAFVREGYEFRRFRAQGETAADARIKLTVRQTLFSLVVNTWTAGGTALVLGVGAYHVLTGHLTIGQLMVFLAYIAAVYGPLETISSSIGSMQQQLVTLQGAFYVLDAVPDIADAPDSVELSNIRGAVAFEGVGFAYGGRNQTLKDITFSVLPGQRIAIVGPTGAGKTTLISLIKRFHDAKTGRVLVDGIDVKKLKLKSLREQVSVVLQVPELFSGTIAENIRYGRLEATTPEIEQAAKAANAHDFIERLPLGYETVLGEGGAQLSVGERQRVCVARAFLKDAPILILDEPTSSIDSITEAVILDALDRLSAGRTTFVIAHRLSTIRHADLVLVLDDGQLVERGTHKQLMARHGLYRQLHDVQLGGRKHASPKAVISIASALSSPNGHANGHSVEAEVTALLARTLESRGIPQANIEQAAFFLVKAVQPLIVDGAPDAERIRAALRSSNPLREPRIAAAFADAILQLQEVVVSLAYEAFL